MPAGPAPTTAMRLGVVAGIDATLFPCRSRVYGLLPAVECFYICSCCRLFHEGYSHIFSLFRGYQPKTIPPSRAAGGVWRGGFWVEF